MERKRGRADLDFSLLCTSCLELQEVVNSVISVSFMLGNAISGYQLEVLTVCSEELESVNFKGKETEKQSA